MLKESKEMSSNKQDNDDFYTDEMPKMNSNSTISAEKLYRMSYRTNKKAWMFYPEDRNKVNWDLYITLILLVSCITTPWRIAFGEDKDPTEWIVINYFIDSMFLIDIFVIFNSAFHDDDFEIVECRKEIAKRYL